MQGIDVKIPMNWLLSEIGNRYGQCCLCLTGGGGKIRLSEIPPREFRHSLILTIAQRVVNCS